LERSLKEGLWHFKVVSQKREVSHWRGLSVKACDMLNWSHKRGWSLIGEVSQDSHHCNW
jgi:hypothetical protein